VREGELVVTNADCASFEGRVERRQYWALLWTSGTFRSIVHARTIRRYDGTQADVSGSAELVDFDLNEI